jgi:hypothetical protein
MTTTTTIPTDPHGNTGDPVGPIDCARCSLSLVDRHPDSLSIDSATWEHDTGDGDLAICESCQSEAVQGEAWLQIVRWQNRDHERRTVIIGRHGLQLDDGSVIRGFVRGKGGFIDPADARAIVVLDKMQPRFDLLAGAVEECPETERNVEHETE